MIKVLAGSLERFGTVEFGLGRSYIRQAVGLLGIPAVTSLTVSIVSYGLKGFSLA